jgi:hypothetical protein
MKESVRIPRRMLHQFVVGALVLLALATASASVKADFPENALELEDDLYSLEGITEAQFREAIDSIGFFYRPLVFFHGGRLVFDYLWTSPEVNAYASRSGTDWHVEMHGGLARRREITLDGFKLVTCHEIGHHLGGYPFKGDRWASSEGESDWYATQACARWIWRTEVTENAKYRTIAPASVRGQCDAEWTQTADRDLCYRIAMAGKSLADLLAAMAGTAVRFDAPDNTQVATTNIYHPAAQCRLDTYLAGALCTVMPSLDLIPGEGTPFGRNSVNSELAAAVYSCMPTSPLVGALNYNGHDRPRCWFKPQLSGVIR